MLLDIHVHTAKYSPCSTISLLDAVLKAREVGLDGICVTDHDTDAIRYDATLVARETGFTIFVGMEILTFEGDLLVFGLPEPPAQMMHAAELIEKLATCGGITVAAHPFRDNGRGLGDCIVNLPELSGVEVLNGRTAEGANTRAKALAVEYGFACLGGSDAHRLEEIGRYVTFVPGRLNNVNQFIQAVQGKRVTPVKRQFFNQAMFY